MKKILLHFWFFMILTVAAKAQGKSVQHVILISIDGFRPEFYTDTSLPAPHLRALKENGVYADGLKSVFPSVTYPSHTTIITGALPARHGIYYNVPFGEKNGHWYWEESYIKTPTLWDAVQQAGLVSAAIMWPVTVGAPINYNFPVRRADNDQNSNQLDITRPYITPAGLIDEIQEKATGKLTAMDFNDDQIDRTIGEMAAYIFKTYKPDLTALHFLSTDHSQHQYGREGLPVSRALALVDSMVNVVLLSVKEAGLENNTTIMITGDHGFVNNTQSFAPNILLAQQGLISQNDWVARFHAAGGSTFLYLKNKQDQASLNKVVELLNNLPEEQKKLFRIVNRAELDKVGANPEVALALAMSPGVVAGNEVTGDLVREIKKGGNHGYFPDFNEIRTGFIAIGAGIGPHREIQGMGIKDIAPLIAKLLNLNFQAPDGILQPGILKNKQ